MALADDGQTEERNLLLLCSYCNRVKGTKGKDGYRLKMAEPRGGQRGHRGDGGREAGDAHWQAAGPLPPRRPAGVTGWLRRLPVDREEQVNINRFLA